MCPERPHSAHECDHPLRAVSAERHPSPVGGELMSPRLSGASSRIDPRGLLLSGVAALAAGLVLWKVWWWAGYPLGAFRPGLDGHGPDPYAWPRLLALWVPAAHALFAVAYVLLAREDSRGTFRRCFRADQWSLLLVLPLVAGLVLLGGHGPWRLMIGVWYTLFVGVKTGILVTGLWLSVADVIPYSP